MVLGSSCLQSAEVYALPISRNSLDSTTTGRSTASLMALRSVATADRAIDPVNASASRTGPGFCIVHKVIYDGIFRGNPGFRRRAAAAAGRATLDARQRLEVSLP
jgi:hypothetical protein